MHIRLNGNEIQISLPCTLEALLIQQEQLKPGTAVALNQQVIPRSQWSETQLNENDDVDLFRAIAGG